MASIWDDIEKGGLQSAQPASRSASRSIWDDFEGGPRPVKAESRNPAAFLNDTVITTVNAGLGIAKGISDFVSVDNPLSRGLEYIIKEGQEKQSDIVKQAESELGEAIDTGGFEAVKGVGKYVFENPIQTAAKIVGGVGPIGKGIQASKYAAQALKFSPRGQGLAGLGAGVTLGGAAAGGDAASDAYDQVMNSPNIPEDQRESMARQAARQASVVPAILGGLSGATGLERIMSGARGITREGIRRTAGKEFLTEGIEEGGTKASANIAAMQYDPTIDPMRGVVGSATMGGVMGLGGGAGVAYLNNRAYESNILGTANPSADQSLILGINPGAGLSTQDLINVQTGVTPAATKAQRAAREADIKAALAEPSGRYVTDENGIERELTMGEAASLGYETPELGTLTSAEAPSGETTSQVIGDDLQAAASKVGLSLVGSRGKPNVKRIEAFTRAVDLLGSGAIDRATFDQTIEQLKKGRYAEATKSFAQIEADFQEKQRLANQPKFQRAPKPEDQNVSTTLPATGELAPSVDAGGIDVSGGLAPTGSVVTDGPSTDVGSRVAGISPAGNETSLLGNVTGQPSTPVSSRKRRITFDQPQQGQAFVAPETATEQDQGLLAEQPAQTSLEDQAAIEDATQSVEGIQLADLATTEEPDEAATDRILDATFANSKDKARDIEIAKAYLAIMKGAPSRLHTTLQALVGKRYGIGPQAVRKIANTTKMVDAAVEMGMTPSQARNILGVADTSKGGVSTTAGEQTGGLQNALAAIGVESKEGATGGFGYDDTRTWAQGVKGAGDTVNAKDEALSNAMYNLAERAVRLDEMSRELPAYAEDLKKEADKARERMRVAQNKLEQYLTKKLTPTKAKKTEVVEADQDEDVTDDGIGDRQEFAKQQEERRAARAASRKGLEVGDTVQNPKLGTGTVQSFSGDGDATMAKIAFKSGQTKDLMLSVAKLEKVASAPVTEKAPAAETPAPKKTRAGKAKAQVTGREVWENLQKDTPGLGDYDGLSKNEKEYVEEVAARTNGDFTLVSEPSMEVVIDNHINEEQTEDIYTEDFEADDGTARFSKVKSTPKAKNSVSNIWNTLRRLFDVAPADSAYKDFIRVSQTAEQAYKAAGGKVPLAQLKNAQAFIDPTDNRVVHLIADNIVKGSEFAVLLHEVGVHVGLKKKLGANFKILEGQVKAWANSPKGSLEHQVYEAAMARVAAGRLEGSIKVDIAAEELVAYAAEEAALAGVKVKDAPRSKLEIWVKQLHNIASKAFKTFFGANKVPKLSVQDLVNFSFAAAQEQMQDYRSEVGATMVATDSQVVKYYAGPRGTYAGATLGTEGPYGLGLEEFSWNPDDKFGPHTGIQTKAFYQRAQTRTPEYVAMVLTSDESRTFGEQQNNSQDKVLLTMQATRDPQTNVWSLIVHAPDTDSALYTELYVEGLATTTRDNAGNEWSRLEGVSARDNLRLLGEFRRRLTRMKNGEIPNIDFTRVTGSGAAKEDGRPGVYSADTLATKFSKTPSTDSPEVLKLKANKEKIVNSKEARTVSSVVSETLNALMFTEDLFKKAVKSGIKSAKDMMNIYRERTNLEGQIQRDVERVASLYNKIPTNERGTSDASANRFVYDTTREKKWGFKPTWRTGQSGAVTIDPAMRKRWDGLSQESRDWTEAVFAHGDAMLKLKKQTLMDATNSEYDSLIKGAQAAGNTAKAAKFQADKKAQLAQFARLFAVSEFAPYAPMKRFGDHVVVAKSQKYINASEAERTKLQNDPDHYHVSFAESTSSAFKLESELRDEGSFANVETFKKEDAGKNGMYGGLLQAFTKLRGDLDSELANSTDPAERNTLAKARAVVADLYLASLAENSARKAEMRRKGVAGEIDMLRSFATQGRADAQFLATAKYTPQMTEAINKMRREVKDGGSRLDKSQLFNEIMARHNQSMSYDASVWSDVAAKASRVTSVWFLATSPMYYLQNLTQPQMLSVPFMAGRHNYFKTQTALIKAYSQLGGLIKNSKIDEPFDFNNVPADVRTMISTLVDRGRIDIGMETELGKFQVEGEGAVAQGVNKVDRVLRSVGQKMEAINRVSTAMAAYRLELAKTGNVKTATEYADEVISQTHGDYTRNNAPRAFNTNVGKVALQFRKFQLIQLTLLTKLVSNSLKGATKEERTAARTALAFTLGHTAALAGLVGMPGFAAISFIAKGLAGMFGDDEEPYNLEKELYEAMVSQFGEDAATLITRGAPAAGGVDLSGKLGMGNALSVLPFTDFELSKAGVAETGFAAVFGASGALAQRFAEGLKQIAGGEYYRGLEKLAPKGISDAMKAVRENEEGVTRLNGDVLVPADEIAAWESTAKFFGVPVTSDTKRRFLTDIKFENEKAFKDKAAKLKNQYTKARREGDDTSAVREKWNKLQEERVSEGFKREPMSSLLQAPQAQAKRERETAGGIQFNKQTRRFTQELVGEQ